MKLVPRNCAPHFIFKIFTFTTAFGDKDISVLVRVRAIEAIGGRVLDDVLILWLDGSTRENAAAIEAQYLPPKRRWVPTPEDRPRYPEGSPDFPPRAGLQAIEAPTSKLEQISSLFDWAVYKLPWDLVTPNIVNSCRPVSDCADFEGGQASGYRKFGWSVISGSNNRHWDRHGPARIDDIGGNEIPRQFVDGPVE
ncbi:hypothetical protein E4U25_006751 [Claviceps purpurea]|nr:hypothetical protein E4U10_000422 [Claviceps purpurea]KAG6232403.1 hypothetical protein E4U25_006751 [Claviceps purpurea]KAG6292480.1 hypothetical protein E4U45_006919 [Claviceps purpurea]